MELKETHTGLDLIQTEGSWTLTGSIYTLELWHCFGQKRRVLPNDIKQQDGHFPNMNDNNYKLMEMRGSCYLRFGYTFL